MKKIALPLMCLAVAFASSCKKDLNEKTQKPFVAGVTVDTIVGDITVNTTLSRDTYIKGMVYVNPGATLTINAGVKMIGSLGLPSFDSVDYSNNKGTVVVMKGAKLNAVGTANSPIIWTSPKAAGTRSYGDWGGLVLLGKAPIHTKTGATTNIFEALPANDPRGTYGGTDSLDNSGNIQYNRLEFGGGGVIAPIAEINGMTFCGVGAGSIFRYVEVTTAGDDSFEWFGGTINCDHLICFGGKDDDYDCDEGYHGSLQFIIGYRTQLCDNSGSHSFEIDNDASATTNAPFTQPFVSNATIIGPAAQAFWPANANNYFDGGVFLRRNTGIRIVNSLLILQQHPYALVTTPTTKGRVINGLNAAGDSILLAFNVWQTNSGHPVVNSTVEGNPVTFAGSVKDPLSPSVPDDAVTLNKVAGPLFQNTAVAGYNDFKLGGVLEPLAGSPALSGGIDLNALGFSQFVGTTQRGAVRTNDQWTNSGWISIATN
jgi:hypothetical protein